MIFSNADLSLTADTSIPRAIMHNYIVIRHIVGVQVMPNSYINCFNLGFRHLRIFWYTLTEMPMLLDFRSLRTRYQPLPIYICSYTIYGTNCENKRGAWKPLFPIVVHRWLCSNSLLITIVSNFHIER